jgi:uncharacterized protein YdhG (YjbR/CyaY superfamily)
VDIRGGELSRKLYPESQAGVVAACALVVYPGAMAESKPVTTIDAYLRSFPDETRAILENMRQAIYRAAPDAVESISYGMPTFDRNGRHLVFFAGWKRYVSLYPVPAGDSALQHDIAPYRVTGTTAKSTLRFPLTKPISYDLVERVVRFLVIER